MDSIEETPQDDETKERADVFIDNVDRKPKQFIMMKQLSLPERNEGSNAWNQNSFTNHISPFLSPHGSSNTLSGSMYTASEGMRTSASGMTADAFRTPIGGSLASFRRSQSSGLDYRIFSSCHSRLGYMLDREDRECFEEDDNDHDRENALNEEKLKDMQELKRDKSKDSLRDKIMRGIQTQKQTKGACGGKEPAVQIVVKTDSKSSVGSTTKVVHGILKSSVSSDSGSVQSKKVKTHQSTSWGGTKALLIEKVSSNRYRGVV